MFAVTVTIPASSTGYTLKTLLETALADMPVIPRVACIKIGYPGSNDAYLVQATGLYVSTVGDIPDSFGYSFGTEGTFFEMSYPQNSISLNDIIIGGTANDTLNVYGYAI